MLDTSVLLNLVRGKELGERIDRAFGLRQFLHRHVVSIVTHGELQALARRNRWGEDKGHVLKRALENLVTINVDNQALIDAYVQVEEACRNNAGGARTISHNDMWIAATALVTGLPLITTDRDFGHLQSVLNQVFLVDPDVKGGK